MAKKRLRQAAETADGSVAVLCFACRRSADNTKQQGIGAFFKPANHAAAAASSSEAAAPATASSSKEPLQCSKCRRVMEQKAPSASFVSRVLPQIARLRQYRRLAAEQGVPFTISDNSATGIMREPCIMCGCAAPGEGHGLTRLRVWPDECPRPARGGFMGPFDPANLAAACSVCNLMKGFRRVRGYVEACRHVATHRGGFDFGRYHRIA